MKKICMIGAAIALIAATEVKAQNVHWGIEGGYNLNYLTHLQGGEMSKSRSGGYGGFLADIGGGHITFQPGLRYIYKGGEYGTLNQDAFFRVQTNNRVGLHYIEMPLNAVWHSSRASGFMIGGGGFVSFLAAGQDKYSITTQSMLEGAPPATTVEGNRKLDIGDVNSGSTARWDAGLDAFIGYQMAGGFFVKASAEWGMVNLQKDAVFTGESYARNMNYLFGLGYMFGHTKCKEK